jgi:hypothetical protein
MATRLRLVGRMVDAGVLTKLELPRISLSFWAGNFPFHHVCAFPFDTLMHRASIRFCLTCGR